MKKVTDYVRKTKSPPCYFEKREGKLVDAYSAFGLMDVKSDEPAQEDEDPVKGDEEAQKKDHESEDADFGVFDEGGGREGT